jgi:amino acid transporter
VVEQVAGGEAGRAIQQAPTGERIGAWAGLAFAVTFVAYLALVVATGPRFTSPVDEVRRFLEAQPAMLRIAGVVIVVGVLGFLLPFVSDLARRLERAEPDTRWWGDQVRAAAMVSVVALLLSATLGIAISLVDIDTVPDLALHALWIFDAVLIVLVVHLATGLWVAAAGIAILRSAALPRWLGWLGVGLLVPQLAAASWVLVGEVTTVHDAAGGIGQIGAFVVWIPAVAIAMLRALPEGDDADRPARDTLRRPSDAV